MSYRVLKRDIKISTNTNHISGVMVSVISPSGVDRVFEPHSGKTKNYQIGIYCFSVEHAAFKSKRKDW
jgi:hypothetical protein